MTMITPSYLGETIEYSSLHACRSTLEDPTFRDMFAMKPWTADPRFWSSENGVSAGASAGGRNSLSRRPSRCGRCG